MAIVLTGNSGAGDYFRLADHSGVGLFNHHKRVIRTVNRRRASLRAVGFYFTLSGRKYSQVFFKDYALKGIQVSFENDSGMVHSIYFFNGQRDSPEFRVFCGQVDKGINWQSSIEEVKKAYGEPIAEFSGSDSGGTWKRLVFDGIDFRFENGKLVSIGVPGN